MKKYIKIILIILISLCVVSTGVFAVYQYRKQQSVPVEATPIESTDEVKNINFSTLNVKGNSTITLKVGDKYEDEGYVAHDQNGKDITDQVKATGEVNTKKAGNYRIVYTLQDERGNKIESYRDIKVENVKKEEKVVTTSTTSSSKGTNKTTNNSTSNKTTTSNTSKVNKSGKGLPVLMYHFFYDASKGEKGADNNWMEISDFEKQMKYLSDNNFYFPSWTEVKDYVDGKKSLSSKSVVITVDDGDESFLRLAIPVIKKYNVKATSFVVTSWNGSWVVPKYKSSKLDFQSHSHNMHKAGKDGKGIFLTLSRQKAYDDVKKSQEIIGKSTVFCYPFGHYNQTTKEILKEAGYTLAFTTKGGRVYPGMDKYGLPRVRMSKGDSLQTFIDRVK